MTDGDSIGMLVAELYRAAEIRLGMAGIDSCRAEARIIFEELFGSSFMLDLMCSRLGECPPEKEQAIEQMLVRRIGKEPLQYIIGSWEFYGRRFYVGDGVLIPRQDTELLIDTAKSLLEKKTSPYIIDLCSGSGCIPITLGLERPDANVDAVELYQRAYSFLERNIKLHNSQVTPHRLDVLDKASASGFSDVDLIVCNPPYLDERDMSELQAEVECEPKTALFGGKDGLEFYRIVPSVWRKCLAEDGHILFEIGSTQADSVSQLLFNSGYSEISVIKDYCGRDRAVSAKRIG